MTDIQIGQIYYDRNHCWCDGSDRLDMFHVILSGDMHPELDNTFHWCTAQFMRLTHGVGVVDWLKGARQRLMTDKSIHLMELVGSITTITGPVQPNTKEASP